jgi:hypothetical protein
MSENVRKTNEFKIFLSRRHGEHGELSYLPELNWQDFRFYNPNLWITLIFTLSRARRIY